MTILTKWTNTFVPLTSHYLPFIYPLTTRENNFRKLNIVTLVSDFCNTLCPVDAQAVAVALEDQFGWGVVPLLTVDDEYGPGNDGNRGCGEVGLVRCSFFEEQTEIGNEFLAVLGCEGIDHRLDVLGVEYDELAEPA